MATVGRNTLPLVVIVGPTASGKSSFAIDIALKYGGEIICADSRTVYKDMDIGTAKPSASDQQLVKHWGLDLVYPGDRYTAADFKTYALQKIDEIRARNKVPILVGGTGLYIDGILFDYQFGKDRDEKLRADLESLTVEELQDRCIKNNIELPTNIQNRRHLIRAVEQKSINNKRRNTPIQNSIVVGISTDKCILSKRIHERIEQMLSYGVVEEAIMLGKKYGWESEAMTGNIYRLIAEYTKNGESQLTEERVDRIATRDVQLAKRQMTWFRRNPFISWGSIEELDGYISRKLSQVV